MEDSGFKNVIAELNPSYKLPDRKSIASSLIPAAYEECKNNVIKRMADVKKCVSQLIVGLLQVKTVIWL